MCLCAYKIYILYYQRLSCLFFEKGEKTSELVFIVFILLRFILFIEIKGVHLRNFKSQNLYDFLCQIKSEI